MSEPIQVLVVEDDPIHRELLTMILMAAGDIQVCGAAEDGLSGLELAWALSPDLIVLDLMLPGISGMELLRRYRKGGGQAKVLVVTAVYCREVTGEALARGADYILSKPVNYGELVADVRMLCDGIRRRCEELLMAMGEDGKKAGFRRAVRMAAMMATQTPEQMKVVYLNAERKNKSNYDAVEKSLRDLVKRVREEDSETYRQVTGRTKEDKRPNNTQFLTALAQAAKIPL